MQVAFALTSFAAEDPQAHAKEIHALLEERIGPDKPGAAILISRNGSPLYLGGFGLADLKTHRPITPDSLFDLASVSKQFTAAGVLILAEGGKLKLDDPISRYLAEYAVPIKGRPVTIVDLLHHVSGLADYTGDEWDGSDEAFGRLTPESHLRWLNGTKPRRAPGIKYEYNNSGYVLLALIVERLSGQSYAQYLRKHIFEPAGMKETTVLDGSEALSPEAATGYEVDRAGRMKLSPNGTRITGDGNIYTSVRDLAKWDAALRNHRIISKRSQEQAWENGRYDNGRPIKDADGDGYGFGWVIEKKRRVVSHSGSWNGTSTYLLLDLEDGLTVAVLSNQEKFAVGDLAEEILELFEND